MNPRWRIWLSELPRRAGRPPRRCRRGSSPAPGLGPTGRPVPPPRHPRDRSCRCAGVPGGGAVNLDHRDVRGPQRPSQARSVRAGALDADLGDLAEGPQPPQELVVAGARGFELSTPSSAPMWSRAAATCTSRCVSTPPVTARAAAGSTMVIAIPSLSNGQGVARGAPCARRRCDRPVGAGRSAALSDALAGRWAMPRMGFALPAGIESDDPHLLAMRQFTNRPPETLR